MEADKPKIYVIELYEDRQPQIIKFMLPKSVVIDSQKSTIYDENQHKLVVPPE